MHGGQHIKVNTVGIYFVTEEVIFKQEFDVLLTVPNKDCLNGWKDKQVS